MLPTRAPCSLLLLQVRQGQQARPCQHRASRKHQSEHGLTGFLFMIRLVLALLVKTLRNPKPYGEQITGPLKRNGVSIFALDPRFLIQYKLVTPLK